MKISVLIEALTGKFETDTQRASRNFQREMRQMERRAAYFGRRLALALSPVALVAITKKSIDFADSIGKTADKLGFGIEAFQEYRFAASQASISTQTFDMAIQRFTRRMAEAKEGTGEARNVVKELGLQLTDGEGRLRRTEDLLGQVADAFQKGVDPADRLRIAQKLFDSEGVVMVNMLREGAAGLERFRQQARDTGAVLREDLVRDAEQAANKMDEFHRVAQVRIAAVVTENADSIIALTEALIGFLAIIGKATQGWRDWLSAQGVIETDGADQILARMGEIQRELGELRDMDPWFPDLEVLGGPSHNQRIASLTAEFARLQAKLAEISKQPFQIDVGDFLDPSQIPPLLDIGPDPKLVQKKADEIAKIIEGLRDQVATFGMGDEAALIRLVDMEAGQEALNQASDLLGQLRALELEEQKRQDAAADRLALEQEYASIVGSLMTPIERHVAEIERIAYLYEQGIIPNVEDYAEAVNRATARYDETIEKVSELDEFGKQAARNMQDAFAEFLFDPWEEGLDGMLKSFSETIARMAAQAAAAGLFKKLFGEEGGDGGVLSGIFGGGSEGGFGAFLGSLFGGARARGGPVFSGTPYLVGENGPELMVPRTSGLIVPNEDLSRMGGGQVINNTFNLPPVYSPHSATQLAQEANRRQMIASARNF